MKGRAGGSRAAANNHANQCNPNNAAYWSSRGLPTPSAPPVAPSTPAPAGDQDAGRHTEAGK